MISDLTIEEVKRRLIATYNPLEIYIFGSYAWGKPEEDSDLDLLIVIDEYKKDHYKTISDGYKSLDGLKIYKDILIYSKKEFDAACADRSTLCNKIVLKGKKLHSRTNKKGQP
jgi:predicted nucleotidyltransferase